MVSILLLHFNFPRPCAPPYNGLHSTSSFKLFPPLRSCAPPDNGFHFASLFQLTSLRSTRQWFPFYFFISTFAPTALHHTVVSILLLHLNFPRPLRSTIQWSLFLFLYLLCPPALHHTMVSILLLHFNFPFPCAPPNNGLHSTSSVSFYGCSLLCVPLPLHVSFCWMVCPPSRMSCLPLSPSVSHYLLRCVPVLGDVSAFPMSCLPFLPIVSIVPHCLSTCVHVFGPVP